MRVIDKEGKSFPDNKINLDKVPVGESREYEFLIDNNSEYRIEDITVNFLNTNNEIEVLSQPSELEPNQKDSLKIKWNADINTKKGLKSRKAVIKVTANELWD